MGIIAYSGSSGGYFGVNISEMSFQKWCRRYDECFEQLTIRNHEEMEHYNFRASSDRNRIIV